MNGKLTHSTQTKNAHMASLMASTSKAGLATTIGATSGGRDTVVGNGGSSSSTAPKSGKS